MPLLEKLAANITRLLSETSHTSSSNLGGHRSRVALPRLKKIDINCPNPDIYSQFLVYIAIQPECSISIEVGLDDTSGLSDRVPRNIKEMGRLVVQHLTDGFNHRCDASASVTHIMLTIHPRMVHLASWCGFITRFRLKSSLTSGKIPLNIFNSILTSLSSVHFPDTIQEVRLVLFDVFNDLQNIYPGSLQSDEDNRQSIISSILQLFQALGSTVDLYVSFQSLMSLVKLSESHAGVLFPYLQNLHFSSRDGEDESLCIIPFLTRRQLPHISPLRTLHFEHITSGRDLRYLDNFEGLEVIR
ncbi:hypothetical protein BDN70DRAFT_936073 [Pholiota conissans]|uniref:Uncharacterized protein n=1 Tax=Pholiota conissans TaxID=109636 RepID=A0A9P6CPX6_9AGAR|nr:hypothetical protein BDN70DRAFT_936073 [Pholiota conissans]